MHPIASNHFKIIAKVNGVKGLFILDTGASTTFIDLKLEEKFKLTTQPSIVKASGAGPDKIDTLLSKNNRFSIGGWVKTRFPIALIDLSYVNDAFESIDSPAVDGIIGADILKKGFGAFLVCISASFLGPGTHLITKIPASFNSLI